MVPMAEALKSPSATQAPNPLRALAVGTFGGFALGIVARAWMRLIADDPAFTWNGTAFIVIGFTIFGFTQSVAALASRRARRRISRIVARTIGIIGLLPLLVGAGSAMLPTIVAGGLTYARPGWPRIARVVGLAIAAAPVVFVAGEIVDSFGWSLHALAGIVGLVAIYAAIVRAARFTFASRRDRRRVSITEALIMLAVGLLAGLLLIGAKGDNDAASRRGATAVDDSRPIR